MAFQPFDLHEQHGQRDAVDDIPVQRLDVNVINEGVGILVDKILLPRLVRDFRFHLFRQRRIRNRLGDVLSRARHDKILLLQIRLLVNGSQPGRVVDADAG
ncbi:hypothetical protein D3C76_1536520 [compost metagenome]